MKSEMKKVLRDFFNNTSMHGFKYLLSPFTFDRIWWVLWCGVGSACGGVLCDVLWARFVGTPALLVLRAPARGNYSPMPLVAVCPTPDYISQLFADYFSLNASEATWLPSLMSRILNSKPADEEQLLLLDEQLTVKNQTLSEALMNIMPPCGDLVTRLPDNIIEKVENPLKINQHLDLVLECSNLTMPYGCRFFTKYHGESHLEQIPVYLTAGSFYQAHVTFISVKDEDPDKVVDGTCTSIRGYSKRRCLTICKERLCGCSTRLNEGTYDGAPPECSAARLNCLLEFDKDKNTCDCVDSCKLQTTVFSLESGPLDAVQYTYDPIYAGLSETKSIVMKIYVRVTASRIFYSMPTETWLTLLSSIGGAFSLFLGFGFFSALEIVFYFLIKLPINVFKPTERNNPVTSVFVKEGQETKKQ